MVKKSSLFLTIIAVATLIVAVIGASFAYFSYVGESTSTLTTVTGSIASTGLVSTTGGKELSMTLTANQMSYANREKTYHISDTGSITITEDGTHPVEIATMAISGGAAGKNYACDGTITIELPADGNTIKDNLTAGVFYIAFSKGNNPTLINTLDTAEIDLHDALNSAVTKNFKYTLTSGETATTNTTSLKADVYFKNTTDKQLDMAGKSIKVNITVKTVECNVVN